MESIYNLLPVEPTVTPKPKRYKSVYGPMAKKEMTDHKVGKFKTMGPPTVERPNPDRFLRSHTRINIHQNANASDKVNICPGKKPPLPDFRQSLGDKNRSELNSINQNKLLAILSEPQNHAPMIVDSKVGHKYNLNGSGLMKDYIYKKDFGKVPSYLRRRKKEKLKNSELYARYCDEVALHEQLPRLSSEERENLLKLLKEKHSQVYSEFLCQSVIIDTLHKKQKKERLEKALNELENDIKTIEDHEFIYVKE